MVGQRISNCPIVGQCRSSSPMILQCLSDCPMIGQWMSSCRLVGQCIFNCLMVGQCITNCSLVVQMVDCIAITILSDNESKSLCRKMSQNFTLFPSQKSFQKFCLSPDNFFLTKSCYWTVSNFSDPWQYL